MEKTKSVIRWGNGGGILLPRGWIGKEVRIILIDRTPQIKKEVFDMLDSYLEDIIGIYLVGSYARGEESEDSDIDILIITSESNKEMIREGIYSILIVSKELLEQKLKNDLFPVGQMIREARALINASYLELLKVSVTKDNVKWYLETTKEKIDLAAEILEKTKRKVVNNRLVYTLILRIRTLYIIQKLIKNQDYSNIDFVKLIARVSGSKNAYDSYLAIKNDLREEDITTGEEAEKLYFYLKKQLDEVNRQI